VGEYVCAQVYFRDMYMYVCECVNVYIHVYIRVYNVHAFLMDLHVFMDLHTCMYVHIFTHVHVTFTHEHVRTLRRIAGKRVLGRLLEAQTAGYVL
jgi:hypothetical protein